VQDKVFLDWLIEKPTPGLNLDPSVWNRDSRRCISYLELNKQISPPDPIYSAKTIITPEGEGSEHDRGQKRPPVSSH
jgi:hypothetical protein